MTGGVPAGVTLGGMKQSVLTRYRTMAYVTAVTLLVFTGLIVVKYGMGRAEDLTLLVSQIHGILFIVYVVFAFDLGQKARWSFGKLLGVLIAGCIPFAAVVVERRITREIAPLVADRPGEPVGA